MPTIALFCREDGTTRTLLDAMPAMFSAACTSDWAEFRNRVAPVDGGIVIATETETPVLGHDILSITEQFPLKTIVVAARRNTRVTSQLSEWLILPPHVDTSTARHVWDEYYYGWACTRLQMLALGVEQARLSSLVTIVLTSALRSRKPFVSIAALSAYTGINRKTLWRHWDNEVHPLWPVRLLDALDWITLIHLVARKTSNRTWTSLAEWVGLNVRTLGRQAKKLTGYSLSELSGLDKETVFRSFLYQMDHIIRRVRT
jgi:hypothetical protein